jgi:hypothetical protein
MLQSLKDGKQEFRLSSFAGEQGHPLHSDGGIVIFPFTFQQRGLYITNITVYGILFSPIKPDSTISNQRNITGIKVPIVRIFSIYYIILYSSEVFTYAILAAA